MPNEPEKPSRFEETIPALRAVAEKLEADGFELIEIADGFLAVAMMLAQGIVGEARAAVVLDRMAQKMRDYLRDASARKH